MCHSDSALAVGVGDGGQGGVLKEIREMTGQENGQISPYLKMMTDQKIVERMAKKQRGAKYRIIDLLFRLWLNRNVV